MAKIKIIDLNLNYYSLNLNQQIQIQGGLNRELFDFLEANKGNLSAVYGTLGDIFFLDFFIDLGDNRVF